MSHASLQTDKEKEWRGIVLEAIDAKGVQIKVFPAEIYPAGMDGSVDPGVTTASVSVSDLNGNKQTSNVTTANHVIATWEGSDNRPYPPQVVKGEQVIVYQDGDADKYYWRGTGRDRAYRSTERFRLEAAAASKPNQEKDDTNTYFIEFDSVAQTISIKSSKQNGEKAEYKFEIDGKNGNITIADDSADPPNRIIIDTVNTEIHINNSDKAAVVLKGEDIFISAPRDIILTADRQIVMGAPTITLNEKKEGVIVMNAGAIAMNAETSIVSTAAVFGVSAASKISGALVVSSGIRTPQMVYGDGGDAYQPATSDVDAGTNTAPNNDSDTDVDGDGMRTVAAWEQVNAAFDATAEAISEVAKAVPTGVDTSGITTNATASEIKHIKGEA